MNTEIVSIKYHNEANLSLVESGSKLITEFALNNSTDEDWNGIELRIIPTGHLIIETSLRIDSLRAHTSVDIKSLELKPSIEHLCQIIESIPTNFYVVVHVGGEEIYKQSYDIRFMPFDHWLGIQQRPELLAMFVQPNMPDVADITHEAGNLLYEQTGDRTLNGYLSCNPNYVRKQVAVFYEALYNRGITYVLPPQHFEQEGQRVRMIDRVLSEHQGTCLDTTLLMASCLEANGLSPLIVIFNGHAMLGVRLIVNNYFPPVGYDVTYLKNGIANGVNDLLLVETTNLCGDKFNGFEEAVTNGESYLMKHEDEFQLYIDITACRRGNITPLPQLKKEEDGLWHMVTTEERTPHKVDDVKEKIYYPELSNNNAEQEQTREKLWERKLLDLTLNNNLVNIHKRKTIIELLMASSNLSDSQNPSSIDVLEDYLSDGKTMDLTSAKDVLLASNIEVEDFRKLSKEPIVVKFVSDFIKNHQLLTLCDGNELGDRLKEIYRKSRLELEENGTNPLYITIGELVWYESSVSERALHAPLLLLPVELIRKNFTQYCLRLRDEDVMLNSTIFELIKHDFNINIPIPNPLPQDEHGVDVRMILSQIRHAIRQMPRWDVEETAYLGTFSFSKFVMWNDIHNNSKKMKENKIVDALIEGHYLDDGTEAQLSVDARDVDSTISPSELALPLSADSSQIEAVMEAAQGKTFVLHGPPGTGKSQTITNMIANALFKGKTVLFVAEKRAALEVVQHRLTQIGLSPFCLELHSNKATKSHFLAQLEKTLEQPIQMSNSEYIQEAEKVMAQRQQLSSYVNALHNKSKYGISLYDCIENYAAFKFTKAEQESIINFTDEQIAPLLPLSQLKLDEIRRKWEDLDVVMEISGHPYEHPLKDLDIVDNANVAQVMTMVTQLQQQACHWLEVYTKINTFLKLSNNACKNEMQHIKTILENVLAATKLTADIKMLPPQSGLQDLVHALKNENESKAELLQQCNDTIFSYTAAQLRSDWQTVCGSFFLVRRSRKNKWLEHMQSVCPTINENNIDHICNLLEQYEKATRTLAQERETLQPIVQELTQTIDEQEKFQQELGKVINTSLCNASYDTIISTTNRWIDNKTMLRNWLHFNNAQHELGAMGLGFFMNNITETHLTGHQAARLFIVSLYQSVAESIINNDKTLNMFNGLIFERKIKEYRILEQQFKELTKQELIYRLSQRIPTGIAELPKGAHIKEIDRSKASEQEIIATEMAILKRNIKNHGRGNSIRHLIDMIPTLMERLCPCMLMSPMSVAQYIDLNGQKFDIVIFDEASQIPTADAVGAISRGKSLIVVGDPKQMPPTSFFNTNPVSEDELAIDDMESILDDCIALSIPSRYLTYHYRSKHESLIAFSNREYYGNKLFSFPSVDNRVSKVTYQYVNGVYDYGRSRSNKAEAEAIVNEVIIRLKDEQLSQRSMGIVAFSIVQRNLIEDLLTDALSKQKDLAAKAFDVDEPIFIKNLENVQGDERDVILFSIGYGPDKDGKVSMNFGPLNNSGGERRLNVAVSRARYEMKVFSTLHSSQIDLKRTNAEGVRGLKAFLEYAEQGNMPISETMTRNISYNALRKEIADTLRAKGYTVDEEIGHSHFHIDLALVDKHDNSRYTIGIILDGTNYQSVKTVQDREIVQPSVLKGLGWRLCHLWAMDWYCHREKTLQRLIDEIEKDDNETIE